MILKRYFTREIWVSVLQITSLLVMLFLFNQLVRILSEVVSGKVPPKVLSWIFILETPYLMGLLLPLGFYGAVLWVMGRWYTDHEMTIVHASGVSRQRLLMWILQVAGGVALLVWLSSFFINPWLNQHKQEWLSESKKTFLFDTLVPKRFQLMFNQRSMIYVDSMSSDRREVYHVMIATRELYSAHYQSKENRPMVWQVLLAERGYLWMDPETQVIYLVCEKGRRYEGIPGQKNYRIIEFSKFMQRAEGLTTSQHLPTRESTLPTWWLWWERNNNPGYWAELHWRLALPCSVFVLALMTVPLSYYQPRQPRYLRLMPAALLYLLYANGLLVLKSWMQDGKITTAWPLAAWHVALVLLAFGIGYVQHPFRRKWSTS